MIFERAGGMSDNQSTQSGTTKNQQPTRQPLSTGERVLRLSVYIMGVLLVAGMIVITLTIVKRASDPSASQADKKAYDLKADLKDIKGDVAGMTLDGNRLAVHLKGPQGGHIIIFDIRKGREVGRIRLHP